MLHAYASHIGITYTLYVSIYVDTRGFLPSRSRVTTDNIPRYYMRLYTYTCTHTRIYIYIYIIYVHVIQVHFGETDANQVSVTVSEKRAGRGMRRAEDNTRARRRSGGVQTIEGRAATVWK